MKRALAAVAIVLAVAAGACGSNSTAKTDDDPTGLVNNPQSNFLKPPAKARDTVNQLNQQQNQEEQNTGSNYYNP